jgi:uncharacterized protein (DUF58 family)
MIRELWLWVSLAIVIVGVAAQNAALALLGFAVALACGGALLWSRWSLRRLQYARQVPEDHAFPGEEVAVTLRLTNRKALPLPWVEVNDAFPEGMVAPDDSSGPQQVNVEWRTSLGGYERVARRHRLRAGERGVYDLGPATTKTGDGFGLFPVERAETAKTRIVVYPRTVDLGALALPSRRPYGETAGGLRIFEDPSRIAGLRDYQPGDPMRRIDWNATARVGRLQSRVYDPTSSQHLLVCLNTATMIPDWAGFIPETFERSITVAASIARHAHEERYAVGLVATCTASEISARWRESASDDMLMALNRGAETRRWSDAARFGTQRPPREGTIRIAPGRRAEQFVRVLESLAVITPFVLEPLARILDREEHRLAAGTTLTIVTAIMPVELSNTLLRLRRRGHRLSVLSTSGELWPDLLPGVDVRDYSWVEPGPPLFKPPAEVHA